MALYAHGFDAVFTVDVDILVSRDGLKAIHADLGWSWVTFPHSLGARTFGIPNTASASSS